MYKRKRLHLTKNVCIFFLTKHLNKIAIKSANFNIELCIIFATIRYHV